MLGIEDYGSDSDTDNDSQSVPSTSKRPLVQKYPKKSTSPPTSLALPSKVKRGPKKITIGLPALLSEEKDDDVVDERPAAKKPRLQSGAGASSLVSMLPAPKQKNPVLPLPVRMLGDGRGKSVVVESTSSEMSEFDVSAEVKPPPKKQQPPSLSTPAVDVFSIAATRSSMPALSAPVTMPPTLSSAPKIDDFTPPEPTPTDLYPGYYLLPSGAWAAYDPAYYQTFYKKWEAEYEAHVRALEKGMAKGFEGFESAEAKEVDAIKVMEKAKREIQEREERKAVTHGAAGAPAAPNMNIKGAKLGGRARSRHQLSTLLNEAYQNREALEERIAEGRRNRKEAGNKYGF